MNRWWLLLVLVGPLLAQEEEEVEEIAFSVAGQVVTDAGRPCANAQVHVWDALAGDRPLAHGRTDDKGGFRLDVTRTAAARRSHPFGPVRVVARAAGRARNFMRASAGSSEIRLTLARPGKWAGVVTDAQGTPLPGAPVRASQGSVQFNTTTDETGRFSFGDMAPGEAQITFRAAGHETRVVRAAAGEPLAIQLAPMPLVSGRVLGAGSERGLAGAHLVCLSGDAPVATDTAIDGAFRIEAAAGSRIAVYADGYAVATFEVDPAVANQHVVLEAAEPVSGLVLDDEGEPVEFASVRLDPGFGAPLLGRTDAAGSFRFPVGVSGFGFLSVARRGFLRAVATYDGNVHGQRVRIALVRGGKVHGSATIAGAARAGVEIEFLRRAPPGRWERVTRAYTSPDGRFRMTALPPAATHARARLGLARSAIVPVSEEMRLAADTQLRLAGTVRTDRGVSISGIVVTLDTDPVTSVKTDVKGHFDFGLQPVRVYRLSVSGGNRVVASVASSPGEPIELVVPNGRGLLKLELVNRDRRSAFASVVLTQDDLRRRRWLAPDADMVTFDGLAAGPYVVEMETPGYLPTRQEIELRSTMAGPTTVKLIRAGTLRVHATPGASLVVQTLEGEPAPLASAKLTTGKAEYAGFGPGRYRLLARAKGELIAVAEVTVGASDAPREIDLVGGAASTLVVTVTDGAGKPVLGAALVIFSIGDFRYAPGIFTDAEGKATLPRLIRGHIRVVATLGDARVDKGLAVEPGQSLSLALELR